MEFALTDCQKNPTEFSDELNTLVAQAYLELAEIDYDLGRLERAKVRLQLSLDAKSSGAAQNLLDKVSNSGDKETKKRKNSFIWITTQLHRCCQKLPIK